MDDSQDIHKFHRRAQEQAKGPAPHKDIAMADEQYYQLTEISDSSKKMSGSVTAGPTVMKNFRSKSTDPASRAANQLSYDTGHMPSHGQVNDIHPILQRIESRLFNARPRAYQVFKNFDVDNDGTDCNSLIC